MVHVRFALGRQGQARPVSCSAQPRSKPTQQAARGVRLGPKPVDQINRQSGLQSEFRCSAELAAVDGGGGGKPQHTLAVPVEQLEEYLPAQCRVTSKSSLKLFSVCGRQWPRHTSQVDRSGGRPFLWGGAVLRSGNDTHKGAATSKALNVLLLLPMPVCRKLIKRARAERSGKRHAASGHPSEH